MKGDFTRNTHDPKKHYRDVLLQQGRVLVDADWNEQAALTARRDETTAADIIGDCGGPADNAAFGIVNETTIPLVANPPDQEPIETAKAAQPPGGTIILPTRTANFLLSAGRYYVDGIQCENEEEVLYTRQPDRFDVPELRGHRSYLVYLDVWQRHITVLEDGLIREPALGGPDHGTRVKTVWQVYALALKHGVDPNNPCGSGADQFDQLFDPGTAKLTAGTVAQQAPKDPCLIPASAGYTGLENELYRVEIHDPSTWKWSRENGSVVTRVERINGNEIKVTSLGPDKNLGFAKDAWVEILDDALELEGKPGQLAQIDGVDEATRITKVTTVAASLLPPGFSPATYPNGIVPERHPKLRRWERVDSIQVGSWLPLESGVQVKFDPNGDYRTGQYWQIPARAATAQSPAGEIEWQMDATGGPAALPAFGIKHHLCRLGIVTPLFNGSVQATDCRCLWPALTNVPRLFYVSGDGQEVMPQPVSPINVYKLPQPLIVGVANAQCLKQPAKVRFTVTLGGGRVTAEGGDAAGAADIVEITTDAAGLASCDFHLFGEHDNHQVTARLLDANGNPVSLPLIFNANLSVARQVFYNPGHCGALRDQLTVQDAISRLASLTRLEALGGDGQDGEPGKYMTNPIRVLVISSCGPVANAHVQFDLAFNNQGSLAEFPSSGTPPEVKSLNVKTGGDGVATCLWKLDPDHAHPTQELTATLILADTTVLSQPAMLRFTANLRPGKDCCVTVGQGGDFPLLGNAIDALKRNVEEICICLLPGDHIVPQLSIVGATASALPITGGMTADALPANVATTAKAVGTNGGTPPPIVLRHLHIHGCGRASRILLENQFTAQNLSSITFQDLCIYADKAQDRPIYIKDCDDVTITGCHVRNQDTDNIAPADLVTIHHETQPQQPPRRRRTYIANNVIECEGSISALSLDPGFIEPPESLPAGSQMVVETAVSSLATKSKSQRAAFVKKFRKIVKGTPKSDPNKQALEAALKRVAATPRSARESKAATAILEAGNATITPALPLATTPEALAAAVIGPNPSPLLMRTIFGPALVIADADAELMIVNNIIKGEVRLYGMRKRFELNVFMHFARWIEDGLLNWVPTPNDAKIEGNSLTEVTVDETLDDLFQGPHMPLSGIFNRLSLLNNTFSSSFPQNEWLAANVISNGNHFVPGAKILGIAAGASFICIGTSVDRGPLQWFQLPIPSHLQYAVPNRTGGPNPTRFQESANLITLTLLGQIPP